MFYLPTWMSTLIYQFQKLSKYTYKKSVFYLYIYVDNFLAWQIKVDIHVGKVKHENNYVKITVSKLKHKKMPVTFTRQSQAKQNLKIPVTFTCKQIET